MHEIPADRNKTDLTHAITEGAAKWLSSIGAKCIETEVTVGPKWIADVAAFWSPTPTEATLQKLIPRAPKWPHGYGGTPEQHAIYKAHRDARFRSFNVLPKIITIAVEVKTTRYDFKKETLRDGKFNRPHVTDIQILAIQKDMLDDKPMPSGWWLLELEDGLETAIIRANIIETNVEQKMRVIAAIAERRHNRTANVFFSALSKRRRHEAAEQRAQR